MHGFTAPGVLFLGSIDAPIRAYLADLFPKLRANGYERLVEPCAGAFAVSLTATSAGWPSNQVEVSDVSLFSALLGCAVNGTDISHLGIKVDGEGFEPTSSEPIRQVAEALFAQCLLRHQVNADRLQYWRYVCDEMLESRDAYVTAMLPKLGRLAERLHGAKYEGLDLFDHLDRVADDPHAVAVVSPPTYAAGYEKFFNTNERLTWAEPEYSIFDPETGAQQLYDRYRDAKCLLIQYEECDAKRTVSGRPVFGQVMTDLKNNYLNVNRPDEVLALQGGKPRTHVGAGSDATGVGLPFLPPSHQVTPRSKLAVMPITTAQSNYYRALLSHNMVHFNNGLNALVLVDGHITGAVGWDLGPCLTPKNAESETVLNCLLVYGSAVRHDTLRLGRLLTMIGLHRQSVPVPPSSDKVRFALTATKNVVTVETMKHQESKPMRGLMKLSKKEQLPNGLWKLQYVAPWDGASTLPELLEWFLTKEERWRKTRSNSQTT